MTSTFVCFECGEQFAYRHAHEAITDGQAASDSLGGHWAALGHGPEKVQDAALSKARNLFLTGEAGPDDSPDAPVLR